MSFSKNLVDKKINYPVAFVNCTLNNTIVAFLNSRGKLLFSLSSGNLKYKGSNKGSRVASQHVVKTMGTQILGKGYNKIIVKIKGLGKGRNFIIKELTKVGLTIIRIFDNNNVPFNGCRIKKIKR